MAADHSTGTTVDARLRWRQSNHDAARICREPDLGHKPTPSWLGISAYSHDSRGPTNWIM